MPTTHQRPMNNSNLAVLASVRNEEPICQGFCTIGGMMSDGQLAEIPGGCSSPLSSTLRGGRKGAGWLGHSEAVPQPPTVAANPFLRPSCILPNQLILTLSADLDYLFE